MSQTFSYADFKKLLEQGEHEQLDFKVLSKAFMEKKATVELVKDIVALANNGYKKSFLVIGVSDDMKGFRSVDNAQLKELNIQALCKDSIIPAPRLSVYDCKWNHAGVEEVHKDKRFVIIQVGPNPRQCFRFAKDYIDWDDKFHFRKHEVWVRRGSTSDTAQPAEIKRLLEGMDYKEKEVFEDNIIYLELMKTDILEEMRADFTNLVKEKGGLVKFIPLKNEKHNKIALTTLPIGNVRYHLATFIVNEYGKNRLSANYYQMVKDNLLPVHHGIMVISPANSSKPFISRTFYPELNLKRDWGNFILPGTMVFNRIFRPSKETPFILDLPKITTREILTKNFLSLYDFLANPEENERALKVVNGINEGTVEK